MKKLLYLFAASLLAFTSCSKDDNDSTDPAPSILVKKIIDINIDGSSSTRNYEYNGNKIVSMTEDGLLSKYTYTGDLITKIEEIDAEGKVDLTTEYSYTSGKLAVSVKKILILNSTTKLNTHIILMEPLLMTNLEVLLQQVLKRNMELLESTHLRMVIL